MMADSTDANNLEQNKGPPPTCSYEEQYIKVHRSIEEQVNFEIVILLDSNYITSYGISS